MQIPQMKIGAAGLRETPRVHGIEDDERFRRLDEPRG